MGSSTVWKVDVEHSEQVGEGKGEKCGREKRQWLEEEKGRRGTEGKSRVEWREGGSFSRGERTSFFAKNSKEGWKGRRESHKENHCVGRKGLICQGAQPKTWACGRARTTLGKLLRRKKGFQRGRV